MNRAQRDSQPQAARRASAAWQIDTVALCGGSLCGAIVWALDATDIHSGWTEVRAVWNRGAHATRERLSEIQAALHFVTGRRTPIGAARLTPRCP